MNNPSRSSNIKQRKRAASSEDLLFILEEGKPLSLNSNTYSLVPDVLCLVFVVDALRLGYISTAATPST